MTMKRQTMNMESYLMIDGKKVLGIIPARGGSKGLPRKNIRNLSGKPLIAWTIEEAKKSKYIDRLILSSEDKEIINIAKSLGCEVSFVRPSNLAEDDSHIINSVLHAIKLLPGYDCVVLLQPTSPLRSVIDIDGSIEQRLWNSANSCVSVTEVKESPYWMYSLDVDNKMRPIIDSKNTRRQELPRLYILNGAVYVAQCNWILKNKTFITRETLAYFMPIERLLDIDTELDLFFAESVIAMRTSDAEIANL